MRKLFQNFRSEESGATLVEYGVALIVAIIVGGTALSVLADNTEVNMNGACGSMGGTDGAATGLTYTCP